jgi:hydrogenase maturation protein HypF
MTRPAAVLADGDRARRVSVRVRGTVQGVGFRPYVFRLAGELGLDGFVLNDERGVLLEVEGSAGAVERLLSRLPAEAPPLARIEAIDVDNARPTAERGFRIVESERRGEPEALVSPDTATCADCLAELFDPADRRHRYPFINCTNCGPRLTIVRGVPYDRPLTTMAGFEICPACRAEYEDPSDRRFHAQPNACPDCGPRARLVDRDGRELAGEPGDRDAVEAAAELLVAGGIVAVKGIGGFHLACRADDGRAVTALRERKRREQRPFALMAASLAAARELVELTPAEATLLESPERPIVIARRRRAAAVAAAVAPRSADLGVVLPYSPLHHLLLADAGVTLVMTSGNLSDEPIAFRDRDALARLGSIADALLLHDRPIQTRCDDSVLRSVDPQLRPEPLLIRRSRGFVPQSIELPGSPCPLLACGAELKNTFCLAKGGRAWVGHHVGDLKNYETLRSFRSGIEQFEGLFAVEPELVVHDLHPDYLSTRYALEREGVETVAVQHHHAHLAACLAEHGQTKAAVGAIYDGAGLGPDETVWGGEILVGDLRGYERVGLAFPVRLPGGDAATREPWRMACSWLSAAFESARPPIPPALRAEVATGGWEAVCRLLETGLGSPLTTSVGRLFDAVAAICGVRARVLHEGQAAAELEGIASTAERGAYPLPVVEEGADEGTLLVLDAREMIRALVADLDAGCGAERAGARFHNGLAAATATACERAAEGRGLSRVVLSGGVFQNRLLVERTATRLGAAGLEVLIPRRLPPNDGGIAYGQAAIAATGKAG